MRQCWLVSDTPVYHEKGKKKKKNKRTKEKKLQPEEFYNINMHDNHITNHYHAPNSSRTQPFVLKLLDSILGMSIVVM